MKNGGIPSEIIQQGLKNSFKYGKLKRSTYLSSIAVSVLENDYSEENEGWMGLETNLLIGEIFARILSLNEEEGITF